MYKAYGYGIGVGTLEERCSYVMTEGQGGGEGTVDILAQHRAQLSKAIDDDDNAWLESVEGHQVRSGLSLVSVVSMCQKRSHATLLRR